MRFSAQCWHVGCAPLHLILRERQLKQARDTRVCLTELPFRGGSSRLSRRGMGTLSCRRAPAPGCDAIVNRVERGIERTARHGAGKNLRCDTQCALAELVLHWNAFGPSSGDMHYDWRVRTQPMAVPGRRPNAAIPPKTAVVTRWDRMPIAWNCCIVDSGDLSRQHIWSARWTGETRSRTRPPAGSRCVGAQTLPI